MELPKVGRDTAVPEEGLGFEPNAAEIGRAHV